MSHTQNFKFKLNKVLKFSFFIVIASFQVLSKPTWQVVPNSTFRSVEFHWPALLLKAETSSVSLTESVSGCVHSVQPSFLELMAIRLSW